MNKDFGAWSYPARISPVNPAKRKKHSVYLLITFFSKGKKKIR